MRPEDIRKIRKRIDSTLSNFRSIYGCYVNSAGEIVTTITYILVPAGESVTVNGVEIAIMQE